MLNSDVELVAEASRQVQAARLAREPWIRERRDQPRSWRTRARWTLAALGLIALHPAELDPLPVSIRAYAHLTS